MRNLWLKEKFCTYSIKSYIKYMATYWQQKISNSE